MIGVFDSGIGGLTLLKELQKTLPKEDFLYFADTKNVPYSYKTEAEIKHFVENAVQFLINKGCTSIVLACNTATNVAVEYLRQKFTLPIVAIQPAVKVAFDNNIENKRILACATPITLKSDRFNKLIDSLDINHLVDKIPLPGLVEFAEKGVFESENVIAYLRNEFKVINLIDYNYIVLGCTHFTYYEKLIEENFKPLIAVDGNKGTARHLKNILTKENLLTNNGGNITFYTSGQEVPDNTYYFNLLNKFN